MCVPREIIEVLGCFGKYCSVFGCEPRGILGVVQRFGNTAVLRGVRPVNIEFSDVSANIAVLWE